MATSLFHVLGSIELPRSMVWVDEFNWSPVEQSKEYSSTGALLLDIGVRQAGRPITLQAKDDSGWRGMTRAKVQALHALRNASPAARHTLTLADGQIFKVMFDGEDAIDAAPVGRPELPSSDYPYVVTLKLIEVDDE